jgi:beta-galactosidase
MMKEGNNLRLYEDGKGLTASVDVTGYGNINSTRVFSIGSQYDEDASAQNNFFPGLLDDVRIYNRALSADEVKRLYNMAEIPT